MTNKEKLKKAIDKDIDLKNYYNEIIKRIEKEEQVKRNHIWKWSLVPICLIIMIGGILFLNYQSDNKPILKKKVFEDKDNNIILNINEITNNKVGMPIIDADVKDVTNNDVNFPLPYINGLVDIPKDLNQNYMYIVYTRSNIESKEYNILNNYIIGYTNGNDRTIEVAYSKEYKPIRDYYFSDEDSKTTIIKGVELKIYKLNNTFFTEFKFNDYNFDIETSKITEQELSTFLLSIIK